MTKKERKLHLKIYVYGNPILKEDNISIKVSNKLKEIFPKISFQHLDPNEEMGNKNPIIMDVAIGISKVTLITNIDNLIQDRKYSLHDYDLAFNLKLLKKVGSIDSIKIIAIPSDYNIDLAVKECAKIIRSI